jgi:hypothetical protein
MSGYETPPNEAPPRIEFLEPLYVEGTVPWLLAKLIPASNPNALVAMVNMLPPPPMPVQVDASVHDPIPGGPRNAPGVPYRQPPAPPVQR